MNAHIALADALSALRPGAQWALRGDTLADLEWLDTAQTAPTQAEIDAQLARASVPTSVTPRQARLALLSVGLLDKVETAVNAAGGATKITWDYATEVRRDDPMITTIGSSLGLTDAALDLLFRQAALIP
jgi:hypothetical protein